MPQNKGRLYNLWNIFGWFEASPNNLTKDERRRSLDKAGWNSNALAQYYYSTINPATDYSSHQKELDEMARYEIVKPIISLYSEECCQTDINKGKTLWYKCSNMEVEKELNEMLDRINVEDHIYSISNSIAGTGNCFRRILRNEHGVQQIVSVPNSEVERVWEPSTKRLIGFKWMNQKPYTPDDSISYMGDQDLFAPWEFIHFRRIEDNNSEYGVGLIEHLFGTYRKIKMAVDNMVVYRLHTMPTRFIMHIDCGNMTIFEMMNQANQMRNLMRNQVSIDKPNNDMQERYNPPATDSIMFFPFRKDEQHKLEKMEGTKDVPDVHDLDLLFKMLFGGARIPKAYIGFEEDSGGLAKASLVSQDIRFARMIRVLRKPIVQGFKRLAELHLAFKGLDPFEHTIEVEMSRISSIEEEMNAATMESQVKLADELTRLCQSLTIPNKEIIDLVFKNYLHVPKEFVEIAKLAAAVEKAITDNAAAAQQGAAAGGGGGMGGGPMGGGMGAGGGIDLQSDVLGAPAGAGATPPPAEGGAPAPEEAGAIPTPEEGAAAPAEAGAAPAEGLFGLKANLLESVFDSIGKKYAVSKKNLIEAESKKNNLTESEKANLKPSKQFVENVEVMRMKINSLLEMRKAKKCSLVESSKGVRTPFTETHFPRTEREKTELEEFVKNALKNGLPESSKKEEHPLVGVVKRMRS